MLDGLGYGLPMVLLPLGADQPLNASRCHELGCDVVLSADKVTAGEISCAVENLLTERPTATPRMTFKPNSATFPKSMKQ